MVLGEAAFSDPGSGSCEQRTAADRVEGTYYINHINGWNRHPFRHIGRSKSKSNNETIGLLQEGSADNVVRQAQWRIGVTRKNLSLMMEWIRPVGIGLTIFFAYYSGKDDISRFHILGPFVVMLMSGTVAFESLMLGEAASEKIGYGLNRAYQIQSGLANAATAITAVLVYMLNWGRFADAVIVTTMLLFLTFSAANHAFSVILEGNTKHVNLLRPVMTLLLIVILLPHMLKALNQ
jgi:hypothetical protein